MSKDEITGRAKKALGELTDDDELKRDGKMDELAGKAKEGIDKIKDKLQK